MTAHILHCPASSLPSGSSYRLQGARGAAKWPMEAGALLGRAGCWNFALRAGGRPHEIEPDALVSLAAEAPVFAALDGPPAHDSHRTLLRNRIQAGGLVIASGEPEAWAAILPELFAGARAICENPYAGVAYRFGGRVELVAPPRWPFFSFTSIAEGVRTVGEVVAVSGERQTPARALITTQSNAPAMVRWRNLVFLNASPFHAFQAWLQGQEDLQPWAAWRHRLFWLDEWVSGVLQVLREAGAWPATPALPIPDLGDTCVVLRHDLDYSRETSYLDEEVRFGVPAVHALLRDSNTAFWLEQLAAHRDHEIAFHYNTGYYSRAANWIRRQTGRSVRPYVPATGGIARDGLVKQVRWAKRRGVGIATLHRHLSFLQYPEWVDAFDEVYRQEPEVLGGSSMFRGVVLRWGVDRADGGRGTYADHPDAQFPYWLPFRLAHAADGGRLLRGWESSSVMEIEPELFEQMLGHRVPGLTQRVFTLNFHPAHARRPTFAADGSLQSFRRVLKTIRAAQVRVLTLRTVFETMRRYATETDHL